jgi:PadR family transcriptional regulator, regulatory protein PadR
VDLSQSLLSSVRTPVFCAQPKRALDARRTTSYTTHNNHMPKKAMPSGALILLILRVLRSGPIHGYAIAQRIHTLSSEVLQIEEGALYPALQKLLLKGWATSEWGVSETNRKVRFYRLTPAGRKQLEAELSGYERVHTAIQSVLRSA